MIKLMGGSGIQVSVEYKSLYGEMNKSSDSSRVNSSVITAMYKGLTQK